MVLCRTTTQDENELEMASVCTAALATEPISVPKGRNQTAHGLVAPPTSAMSVYFLPRNVLGP